MKKIFQLKNAIALAALFILFSTTAKSQTTEKLPIHKIVMQATSADAMVQKSVTKQLKNLKDGWGDSVEIEIVFHGPGIDFLVSEKTQYAEEIKTLMNRKIRFVVCENSMRERKVTKDQFLPGVQFVKMGIGEIVIKQEQGWSYIKAGF